MAVFIDKKNDTKVTLRKINSKDYDNNVLQDNVELALNELSLLIKNKEKNFCLVGQITPKTITILNAPQKNYLQLDFIAQDDFSCFKNKKDFVSPVSGLLTFFINIPIFDIAAPNIIYLDVSLNQKQRQRIFMMQALPYVSISPYCSIINCSCVVSAKYNDTINFEINCSSLNSNFTAKIGIWQNTNFVYPSSICMKWV